MGKIKGWKLGKDNVYRSIHGAKMWVGSNNKVYWINPKSKQSMILKEFRTQEKALKWATNYRRRHV